MISALIRLVAAALLCIASADAASSIDRKISASKKRLASTRSSYANMDRKLAAIAAQIAKNKKELAKLDKLIADAEKQISLNAVQLEEGSKQLVELTRQARKLESKKRDFEKRLVDLLSNRYILEEIKRQKGIESADDVVISEAIRKLIDMESAEIRTLKAEYLKTAKEHARYLKEAEHLKKVIKRYKRKKAAAEEEKKHREALMAKLEHQKKAYKNRLERLQGEEENLRKTLAKLHILKKREEERKRKERAKKRKLAKTAEIAKGEKLKVRTLGSSYQKHAIGRYRGKKTISPVGKARVVKKFGPYTDPIYKIKIFNESVTLQPYRRNAKVKSVLDGRVVFAKDTPMLGKVVIVEHRNGLHTIYAKMDKIAPTIREGKRIRKGYVIGRVEKELMFEVTQKNRHINPLELIRLR